MRILFSLNDESQLIYFYLFLTWLYFVILILEYTLLFLECQLD